MTRNLASVFTDALHDDDKYPTTFPVRGTSFIPGFADIVNTLDRGEVVRFIAERDNVYDPNAMCLVTTDGVFLGHMPKEMTAVLPTDIWNWYGTIHRIHPEEPGRNAGLVIRLRYLGRAVLPDDASIENANIALVDAALTKSFISAVREQFGHPVTDDPTDPLSSTRVSNALRVMINEDINIREMISEDAVTVGELYERGLVPLHLEMSEGTHDGEVIVYGDLPLWWGKRNGVLTLTYRIYRELVLGEFTMITLGNR